MGKKKTTKAVDLPTISEISSPRFCRAPCGFLVIGLALRLDNLNKAEWGMGQNLLAPPTDGWILETIKFMGPMPISTCSIWWCWWVVASQIDIRFAVHPSFDDVGWKLKSWKQQNMWGSSAMYFHSVQTWNAYEHNWNHPPPLLNIDY